MEEKEAELLPSGLLTCLLNNDEARIVKVSNNKLWLRVADKINCISELKICFYKFNVYRYEENTITDYKIIKEEKRQYYYIYTFEIKDKTYSKNIEFIFRDYSKYVTLKNYGYENEFSEEMVGYPSERDYEFYEFYDKQKFDWMLNLNYKNFNMNKLHKVEMAIVVNNEHLYDEYLRSHIENFKEIYLKENFADNHELFKKKVTRLYIGNEFCHNLFPDLTKLLSILEKSLIEDLNVTLCFTYLRQCYIKKNKQILDTVYEWCEKHNKRIEIVINDWGMVKLVQDKKEYFTLCLGVLLNKRKKDPRYYYKKGYFENKELIAKNSLNVKMYRDFLKEQGITRYEYESCGYKMSIAEGKHSLHMPFYITNTSQYCTLYAMCTNFDRGDQILVKNCPKYCTDYVFSYPKHLKMVGRYNSIFVFDDTLLKDFHKLEYYLNNGIDRIVLNFI